MYNFFSKILENNLFSLKIKQFLFGPIRYTLLSFGPIRPTLVQFGLLSLIQSTWSISVLPLVHLKLI